MKLPRLLGRAHPACLLAGAALATAMAIGPQAAHAAPSLSEHWTATWGATPTGPVSEFADQTLRLIVHTSIGGNLVRIRLSNEAGRTPVVIGAAHVAARASGPDILPGTDRQLTFGGRTTAMIAPGAQLLSDPVELNVAALSDLAVSVYLPGTAQVGSDRGGTSQTSYVSLPGDFSGAPSLPVANTIWDWPLLAEVDVDSENGAVVALGDALTAGRVSALDANNRWPDLLARRLLDARVPALRLAVVNLAAGGNQLLPPAPGRPRPAAAALDRFEHDVPATAGVRYMVAQLGIEDIGYAAKTNPSTVKELIAAYSQLIARAHARGIAIFGATLTPFEGTGSGFYSPAKELVRWQLNTWIRSTDDLDGVVDFDLALRDPMHLARLLPAYDSGDHFHPNDLGYQAMANAVPLDLFKRAAPPAGDTK